MGLFPQYIGIFELICIYMGEAAALMAGITAERVLVLDELPLRNCAIDVDLVSFIIIIIFPTIGIV